MINNTIMNLQGPFVKHITTEILHYVKKYLHNLHRQFVGGDHLLLYL